MEITSGSFECTVSPITVSSRVLLHQWNNTWSITLKMNLRIMPLDPRKKKLSPSFTLFSFFRVGVKRTTSWLTIIMIYTQFVITLLPSQSSFQVSAAFSSSSSNKKELTLYAAGFFPVSTKIPEGAIGRGVLPAVDLALQHINDSPKILPGIHLDLVYNDTEVSNNSIL